MLDDHKILKGFILEMGKLFTIIYGLLRLIANALFFIPWLLMQYDYVRSIRKTCFLLGIILIVPFTPIGASLILIWVFLIFVTMIHMLMP